MKNIFCKQSVIWLLAIVSLASFGMPARAGDNSHLTTPQASPPDVKSHKAAVDVANWGPPTTIPEVRYNDLPISEVAQNMKQMFKDQFDVLLPPSGQGGNLDFMNYTIRLELKNVTAAEIFNAMNLIFETGNTPFRWELITNGHRQTALLRPLAGNSDMPSIDPTTGLPASPMRTPEKPMVFFVGDLLGDPRDGFMTMDDVLGTVTDLCRSSNVPVSVSGHQGAELIVARGTDNDLKFVQDTLTALGQKVRLDTSRKVEEKMEKAKTNATSKP